MKSDKRMRALVTGGTGFVGGSIVRHLLKRGHGVRVLARPSSRTEGVEQQGVEIARGDILERASITAALDGCDTLFHAAAIYELWTPDNSALTRTEVEGTRNALEAAIEAGVSNVVYTSTGACVGERRGVTGDESTTHRGYFLTRYEEAKHRAEQVARGYMSRLNLVIIQPAAVIGPGDRKPTGDGVMKLLNGRFPSLFDGTLTFVDINDAGLGHVLAAELRQWGETYILAAATQSNREFFGTVCRLAGVKMPPFVPRFLAGWFASFEEWKSRRTGRPPLVSKDSFRLTAHGFRVSGARAARELGLHYTPPEDSIHAALEWYWNQGLLRRKPDCVTSRS